MKWKGSLSSSSSIGRETAVGPLAYLSYRIQRFKKKEITRKRFFGNNILTYLYFVTIFCLRLSYSFCGISTPLEERDTRWTMKISQEEINGINFGRLHCYFNCLVGGPNRWPVSQKRSFTRLSKSFFSFLYLGAVLILLFSSLFFPLILTHRILEMWFLRILTAWRPQEQPI